MRDKQIRIRVTDIELERYMLFIKNGKKNKLWKTEAEALGKLIDYWNEKHFEGKRVI